MESLVDKMQDMQMINNLLMQKLNLLLEIENLKQTNMRTQFFYSRKETVPVLSSDAVGTKPTFLYRKDSFNLSAVIRSIEMADGSVLVLLNDIHERTTEAPNINTRNNKMTGMVRKRDTFQSEIYLTKEDGERFYRASAVDEPLVMDMDELKKLTHNGNQDTAGTESLSGVSRGDKK